MALNQQDLFTYLPTPLINMEFNVYLRNEINEPTRVVFTTLTYYIKTILFYLFYFFLIYLKIGIELTLFLFIVFSSELDRKIIRSKISLSCKILILSTHNTN